MHAPFRRRTSSGGSRYFPLIAALACLVLLSSCGTEPDGPTTGEDAAVDTNTGGTDATGDDTASDTGSADTGVTDSGSTSGADGATAGDAETDANPEDTGGSGSSGADTDAGSSSGPDTGGASSSSGSDTAQPPVDAGTTGPVKIDKYSEHSAKCTADADCAIPCGKGQCSQGKCAFIPFENTCLVELKDDKVGCYGDGMDGNVAKCLRCNTKVSQESLTSVATLLSLDDDTDGMATDDVSKGGILWTLSDSRSVSGGTSLYFGDPKSKVYANDKHVKATTTTPKMAIPKFANAKPEVAFWLWLSTEESKGYDYLKVEIVGADGKAEQVWHSDSIGGTTHGIWKSITLDAAKWQGADVQVRFTFDSIDTFVNAFEGAYIDDIAVRTGCCGSVSDCNDGNACSTDTCAPVGTEPNPVCTYDVKKACCNSAADCDDGKSCTLDICSGKGGTCSHSAKPGCCNNAADCDDKDSCTIDHCPKAGAQCQHTNTCCKGDGECNSEDPCLVGGCNAGECVYASICCNNDVDCDDFNNCTLDACDADNKCAHTPSKAPGCCSPVPWADDFEVDISAWKPDPAKNNFVWHHEKPKDAAKVKSGAGVLKFGIPGKPYTGISSTTNYTYILSPMIELPANQDATLKVDVLVDSAGSASYNRVQFYSMYQGKSYYLGFISNSQKGWQTFTKDLSHYAGTKFQLRMYGRIGGFGSSPASGTGLYVDNLRFETGCTPKKCGQDSECKTPSVTTCRSGFCVDGTCKYSDACCAGGKKCDTFSQCVVGTCSGTYCSYKENKECCDGDKDCDDGNPCTVDVCPGPGEICKHNQKQDCCVSASECNDGDKCTEDKCVGNKCANPNLCCKADKECSDGESKCTVDTCAADGFCAHKATGAKGCCEPDVWSNDFDTGDAKGMKFSNSQGASKGWQLWSPAFTSKSGKGVLYYGDKVAQNYNFGSNKGTATTGDIKLPADTDSELTWDSYLDTESSSTYDALKIYVIVDGSKKLIYQKGITTPKFASKTWQTHKHSLTSYKGKTIKLEFDFNTTDSVSNSGKGVFIDNLKFTTKCPG